MFYSASARPSRRAARIAVMITLLLTVPFLFSITPSSAPVGAPGTPIVVEGRGFTPDSVVRWNGADRPTVFVSAHELRARLRPSDFIAAEPGYVSVFDRATRAGSAAALFQITAPAPDESEARLFLLAPTPSPPAPQAPSAQPAVYSPQRAATERPVEPLRVPGKTQL